jgi:RNA polymerase sigma factor (sigma-70 family)
VTYRFQTTNWSLVLAARSGATQHSRDALAALCESYWYPIYAFIRSRGQGAEDARDLTQAYFTQLLDKGYLDDVRQEAGRFRSFLFASICPFLSNERDRAEAAKRGSGRRPLPLELDSAEKKYRIEPVDELTPEKVYERHWALAVLERALARLQDEQSSPEMAARARRLLPYLTGEGPASHREVAEELGMSEAAVRQSVHRMRKRFGQFLRQEVGQTVADPAAVDSELRHLLAALG